MYERGERGAQAGASPVDAQLGGSAFDAERCCDSGSIEPAYGMEQECGTFTCRQSGDRMPRCVSEPRRVDPVRGINELIVRRADIRCFPRACLAQMTALLAPVSADSVRGDAQDPGAFAPSCRVELVANTRRLDEGVGHDVAGGVTSASTCRIPKYDIDVSQIDVAKPVVGVWRGGIGWEHRHGGVVHTLYCR